MVATINGVGLLKETREFGTFTSSLTELRNWLSSQGITHVAMESTGVYWKPVYKVLKACTGFVEEHHIYMLPYKEKR